MGAAPPPYPSRRAGEGREAAPGSSKADDFKAWIIGRSGGYRNLAVRGKKGGGEDDVGATLVVALFPADGTDSLTNPVRGGGCASRATTRVAPTAGD